MIDKLLQNGRIVINSDIDGVISGLLLTNFCGCTVVGFTNSIDRVWLDTSLCPSLYDGVYIDMFVAHPEVVAIDQHIVGINAAHCRQIAALGSKLNPNLENLRSLVPSASYVRKYPFGTCHYIIAQFCRCGVDLDSLRLNNRWRGLRFADFLLRADDAMNTSLNKYPDNARYWWRWLLGVSNQSAVLQRLVDYLYYSGLDFAGINRKLGEAFMAEFRCDRPDGGVACIAFGDGAIKDSVKNYVQFVAKLGGLRCFGLDLHLTEYVGKNIRIELSESQRDELIRCSSIGGEPVFSYAFVHRADVPRHFSYTVMNG